MVRAAALALTWAAYTTPPSDNELRAGYCLGVIEHTRPRPEEFPAQFQSSARDLDKPFARADERLRAYLLPKTRSWELEGLEAVLIAKEQGKRAVAEGRADIKECIEAKFLPF